MTQFDLIAESTAKGVTFKTLGEVGEFIRGNGLQKSDLTDQGAPAIHYGQIHTFYGTWTTYTKSFVAPERAAKFRQARPGDLVIATTSEDDAAVAKATAWIGEGEVAVSGDAYIYRHTLDPRYVAYFFQSRGFQDQKKRYITGTKVRRISGDSLAKIRIPVPSLNAQEEIVRTLDTFTELDASLASELTAELASRGLQYIHYRDALLSFGEGVQRLEMGELGSIFGGLTGKSKPDFTDGNARFISYVNVFNNITANVHANDFVRVNPGERQRTLQHGDILFTASSETPEDVGMSSVVTAELQEPIYLNSFCIGFRLNDTSLLDPEFAKHLFRSEDMRKQIVRTASGVTRFNVSKARLAQIEIPIPSIDEQRRIADILDRLDNLVKELAESLQNELNARRKQFVYCRDRLLTFEELTA